MKISRSLLNLFLLSTSVCAAELSPQDFARGTPLITTEDAAFYQSLLPESVYHGVVYADLRDLRVFNADGQMIPYLIAPQVETAVSVKVMEDLPFFPLYTHQLEQVQQYLRIQQDGTLIELNKTAADAREPSVMAYILDLSRVNNKAGLLSMQLQWRDSPNFLQQVRVDSSDDLQHWRQAVATASIADMHYGSDHLRQNSITVPAQRNKYVRLSFAENQSAPEVIRIQAQLTETSHQSVQQQLRIAGVMNSEDGAYDYDLGAAYPTRAVNVLFAEKNQLLQADIFSRATADGEWRHRGAHKFYRLSSQDVQLDSQSFRLQSSDRYWRIKPHQVDYASKQVPQLEVTWQAANLKFIASGKAPYWLAYGKAGIDKLEPAVHLLASFADADVGLTAPFSVGDEQVMAGEVVLQQPVVTADLRQKLILWSVLGVGLLLLAGMVWRLLKEMNTRAN